MLAREREGLQCSSALIAVAASTPSGEEAAAGDRDAAPAPAPMGCGVAGVVAAIGCCTACRTGSGVTLKTPELLSTYFDVLAKRLAVASTMERDIVAWRSLQRDPNTPAPPERFPATAVRPSPPTPQPAAAVAGVMAVQLPAQLGARVDGVVAAPPRQENKKVAQHRWREAAKTILERRGETVEAAPLLAEITKIREAEAERLGIEMSHLPEPQTHDALKQTLYRERRKTAKP